MKQIWIKKAGPPEVLQVGEAPTPLPHTGEVRIKVEAAGVNFADIMGRLGIYPDAPPIPYVPGYEIAGTIDAVGHGAGSFSEGDKVFALTRFGGYSDQLCVPYKQVFPRFDWLSAQDAAAIPVNYLTAYMALSVMGSLNPGDKVLIHGAAGGVGLAALDICNIVGAETFGTASPSKHEFLTQRRLNHAIDYRSKDYETEIMDLTGGSGVQIVLDPLGGNHWAKGYRLLAPGGRLIHFGASSAATGKKRSLLELVKLVIRVPLYTPFRLMSDNKSVAGINIGHLWAHPELVSGWMKQLLTWYDEALFRPHIDRTFKFSQAAEAHHYLQDRKNIGKVLLIP